MEKIECVLVVDDEVDIREAIILGNKLSHRSFKEAENGYEAFKILKVEEFSAVICDVSMPKVSGIELLKMVRELGITTPFIFLSGHAGDEILSQIEDKGIVKFLEKTGIRQLPRVITESINEHELQKSKR